jgi:hypothetical protein
VNAVIEVTAPATVSLTLVPGATATSTVQASTVNSNVGWTLAIQAGNSGFMANATSTNLQTAMSITGGNSGGVFGGASGALLDGNSQILAIGPAGPAVTNTINNIYFSQPVSWTDSLGSYSINVTFTGTGSY